MRARADGRIAAGSRVGCGLTGHGLKDPDTALGRSVPAHEVEAELAALEALLA